MNKKAQTEDMTELIISIIIIFVGVFVINFASMRYGNEIEGTKGVTSKIEDRESFSIEGMMNHETRAEGKKQKIIDLIGKHERSGKYKKEIEQGINGYMSLAEIGTCYNIKIEGMGLEAGNCQVRQENKEREEAIIPLPERRHEKIILEYGENIGYIMK